MILLVDDNSGILLIKNFFTEVIPYEIVRLKSYITKVVKLNTKL